MNSTEDAEDHLHDTLDEWDRVRRAKERKRKRDEKKRQKLNQESSKAD